MSKNPSGTQRHLTNGDDRIRTNADTHEDAKQDSPDGRADSTPLEPDGANAQSESATEFGPIEDLTLSELIVRWMRAPASTWGRLRIAMASPDSNRPQTSVGSSIAAIRAPETSEGRGSAAAAFRSWPHVLGQRDTLQLLISGAAILCALLGSAIVRVTSSVPRTMALPSKAHRMAAPSFAALTM